MNDNLNVRPIRGRFMISRISSKRAEGRRHETFGAAERECGRLLRDDPDGTYLITREEALISRRRETAASGVPITRRTA